MHCVNEVMQRSQPMILCKNRRWVGEEQRIVQDAMEDAINSMTRDQDWQGRDKKNDSRFLIQCLTSVLRVERSWLSSAGPCFNGQFRLSRDCPVHGSVVSSDETKRQGPYIINSVAQQLHSIDQLLIGNVVVVDPTVMRQACPVANCLQQVKSKSDVWLEPPEELVANIWEPISSTIEWDRGGFKMLYTSRENRTKEAVYAIRAIVIAQAAQHQVTAIRVPDVCNGPIQWTVIDKLKHAPYHVSTASLPPGQVTSLVLYRYTSYMDKYMDMELKTDVDRVVSFAKVIALIVPSASKLHQSFDNMASPDEVDDNLIIESSHCLGGPCDCTPLTNRGGIAAAKHIDVLLHCILPVEQDESRSKSRVRKGGAKAHTMKVSYVEAPQSTSDNEDAEWSMAGMVKEDAFSDLKNCGGLRHGSDQYTLMAARLLIDSRTRSGKHKYWMTWYTVYTTLYYIEIILQLFLHLT